MTWGRQHIREGVLQVRQVKTGGELMVPVHPELSAIIEQVQTPNLTFLITEFGKPFTAVGFSHWFRARCNEAGLLHCSAHGLRRPRQGAWPRRDAPSTRLQPSRVTPACERSRATPRPPISRGLPALPGSRKRNQNLKSNA